jgi:hypothetical protein
MDKRYEYKFVRLDDQARFSYQKVTDEYAGQGWRLLQVYAPGAGGRWASSDYVELVFERPVEAETLPAK